MPEGSGLPAPVAELVSTAAARFADLGYLAPDGILDLRVAVDGVRVIRLELPGGHALAVQSIGIDTAGRTPLEGLVSVHASAGPGSGAPLDDPAGLLAFDRPTGTRIDTGGALAAWAEVRFARPVDLVGLRLRNAAADTARAAKGLTVTARTRWRSRALYDAGAQVRAWRGELKAARAAAADDVAPGLLDVLDLTVRGEYARAHRSLPAVGDDRVHAAFRDALNECLLPARGLEWTAHGPQRPFRSWSEQERLDYVRDSVEVVGALRSLTPDVCLGFGSVLSVVRDRALIPHDDDLDIIVGFDPDRAPTLAAAMRLVEAHLRPLGFEVSGPFVAHRHVRRPGRKRVDVFVGLFEGEAVSWYPAARGGLSRDIVFPPSSAVLLGVECPIPARPEAYLERVYGPGWRTPDPHFSHAWNRSAYADIAGDGASAEVDTAAEGPGPDS